MGWYLDEMECPNCGSPKAEQWIRPDDSLREGYYFITCTKCGLVALAKRVPTPWKISASLINKDIIGKADVDWGVFGEIKEKDEKIVIGAVKNL